MDPNTGYPAGFPVPTQSPQNPMSFYPNSIPQQFPQSKAPSQPGQQQHSFGAMPMQPGVPGGAMMPSGFPQQSAGTLIKMTSPFPSLFTHGEFLGAIQSKSHPRKHGPIFPASSTNEHTFHRCANIFSKHGVHFCKQSARQSITSYELPQSAQPGTPQSQGAGQTLPQNQMQSPSPAQLQAQAQAVARERVRITTLLDINSTLLEEVMNLQKSGKATLSQNADGVPIPQKPSQEYIDCMRRMQANLVYLANTTDKQKRMPIPAIMSPPPNVPALNESYQKLNELFPRSGQVPAQRFSPATMQGNGGPSPSPMPESVV
ncbi:hypothetical protein N7528_006162 [Penicillium herquei]|nr:hypothetical protein N7528_006162 [Penicillium herquei]